MDISLRGLLLALWFALSFAAQAHDTSTTASALGLTWLHEQQSGGGIASTNDSAQPLQATFEAALAFANQDELGHLDTAALSAFLDQQPASTTESLARLLALKLKLGQSIDALETALLARQNPDGGFGDQPGYDSTVYDTAFALQALALTRHKNTPVTGQAISYVLQQQQLDGGFGLDSGATTSTYVTSLVLRALQPYLYTYNVGQTMTEARDYLLALTETGSDWPSDWEAAEFLLAVVPLTTDVEAYKGSLNWLKAQQLANGSWQNDVFATGLALQALNLSENIRFPTAPDSATLKGRLMDASSGQALMGVSINLSPASANPVVSDNGGNFVIAGLQPDQYSILYTTAGYLTATQTVQTRAGQLIDLGVIALQVAPTSALVAGTVTDANDGTALANAVVEVVSGQASQQVVTGLDGSYALSAPAGAATLNVSAAGYQPASANATLVAGTAVKFSPGLYKVSDDPQPLQLTGQVVDADSQLPLAAVSIQSSSAGTSVQSDSQGRFTFSDLQAGEQSFQIGLSGYDGVTMSLVLPQNGRVDVGLIQLKKQDETQSTSLQGRILDADTGLGIAGATVAVDGLATQTDANGHYSLSGIASLEFVVGANASGYVYGATPVSLAQPRALTLDLNLQRADIGGIRMDAVSTDKPEYAAYERVIFAATLSNQTVRERQVRLYVLIQDAQGTTLDRFPAVDLPLPADPSDPEALAHYEQHLADAVEVLAPNETRMIALEMGWNSGRQVPGHYKVIVQALEGSTSQLVAEQSALFDILPTQRLASASLEATPSFALMNSNPEVRIQVSLRNGSNQATQTSLTYSLRTPSGALLSTGTQLVDLLPEETTKEVALGSLQHSFVESGNYPLTLSVDQGTVPEAINAGVLYVPPTVRLTVEQDVAPERVIPGAARKVQVQIQVKGVDGE